MNGLNWWDQILLRPYGPVQISQISIVGAITIGVDLIATAIATTNIGLTANANVELDGAVTPLILTIVNLGANGDLVVDLSASAEQINAKESAANAEIKLGADPLEIQIIRASPSFGTAEIVLSDVARAQAISRTIDIYSTTELAVDITAIAQSANPINIVGNTDSELGGVFSPSAQSVSFLPSSESVMEISGTGSLSAFGKKDLSSSTTLSLTSTVPVAKQRQGLMSDISAKKMADVASETLLDVSYILSE